MPRITSPVASREEFYDRQSVVKGDGFKSGGLAPHASTERIAITIGAGLKCRVDVVEVNIIRITAAGTPLNPASGIHVTPNGGSNVTVIESFLTLLDNTAGDRRQSTTSFGSFLNAGDKFAFETSDDSTTGTVAYAGKIARTEFTA